MKNFVLLFCLCFPAFLFAQDKAVSNENNHKPEMVMVEKMPEFPGGVDSLMKFIYSNLKYPEQANSNKTEGLCVVNFIVIEDGSIINQKLVDDIGFGCGAEALRVVGMMPNWQPGMQKGEPVKVSYNLPIRFTLDPEQINEEKKAIIDEDPIFNVVDEMPEFPGGEEAIASFIESNLQYPEKALSIGIDGMVVIGIVIDENGMVTAPEIKRDIGLGCGAEGLRIVSLFPNWTPGKQKGEAVKVQRNIIIDFNKKKYKKSLKKKK